jgi:hypothetical protein
MCELTNGMAGARHAVCESALSVFCMLHQVHRLERLFLLLFEKPCEGRNLSCRVSAVPIHFVPSYFLYLKLYATVKNVRQMKTTWVRVTVFFAHSACIERLRPNGKIFFALVLEFPND